MARSTTKPRGLLHALAGRLSMNYQRRAMTALLLVFVLDYGDRTLIGALGPTLEHVFHIGNGQLGLLAAAFAFIGACSSTASTAPSFWRSASCCGPSPWG